MQYGQPPMQYGQPPAYSNNGFNNQPPATVIYSNEQEKLALPKQANHAQFSSKICCQNCNQVGMTKIKKTIGCKALLWCIFTFPFGLICLCNANCLNT